jgi:putative hemolysin
MLTRRSCGVYSPFRHGAAKFQTIEGAWAGCKCHSPSSFVCVHANPASNLCADKGITDNLSCQSYCNSVGASSMKGGDICMCLRGAERLFHCDYAFTDDEVTPGSSSCGSTAKKLSEAGNS